MRIEVLHVADCPNLTLARARIAAALVRADAVAEVAEIEVSTPGQAQLVGMSGSPTILVDGDDPFPGAEPSLACRLYRSGDTLEGAPTVEALVAVFMR